MRHLQAVREDALRLFEFGRGKREPWVLVLPHLLQLRSRAHRTLDTREILRKYLIWDAGADCWSHQRAVASGGSPPNLFGVRTHLLDQRRLRPVLRISPPLEVFLRG